MGRARGGTPRRATFASCAARRCAASGSGAAARRGGASARCAASPRAAPTEDEILAELPPSHLDHLLTAEEASEFEKNGLLILPGALPPAKAREMQDRPLSFRSCR